MVLENSKKWDTRKVKCNTQCSSKKTRFGPIPISNGTEVKPLVFAIIELNLSEGIRKLVSQKKIP